MSYQFNLFSSKLPAGLKENPMAELAHEEGHVSRLPQKKTRPEPDAEPWEITRGEKVAQMLGVSLE